MPVLQWKKIGQPSKTAGMSGRLCQAKIWLGAAMSNASPHLSVLTMKPHCPLGIVIWNQILSLQSLPTEKLFYFLSTEKRFSNFQSNLLVANLPSFCFCTTNHFTSTSIFLFQLCILMLELLKPASTSLWGTDSRISGTVAVPIMLEKKYTKPYPYFSLTFCCLHFQLSFTKLYKIHSGCFFNIPTIIPSPLPQWSLPTFFKISPFYLPMQTALQNWTVTFHFFMAVCGNWSPAYVKPHWAHPLTKTCYANSGNFKSTLWSAWYWAVWKTAWRCSLSTSTGEIFFLLAMYLCLPSRSHASPSGSPINFCWIMGFTLTWHESYRSFLDVIWYHSKLTIFYSSVQLIFF